MRWLIAVLAAGVLGCSTSEGLERAGRDAASDRADARIRDVARDESVMRDAMPADVATGDDHTPDAAKDDTRGDAGGGSDATDARGDVSGDSSGDTSSDPDLGADRDDGDRGDALDPTTPCTTTFRFAPSAGSTPKSVTVTGEWNGFAAPGVTMAGPDAQGAFMATVRLSPGLTAYKLVVDGQFQLDPLARWRKYVGSIENSAVRVVDCRAPSLSLAAQAATRPNAGQGRFTATVAFRTGQDGKALDPATASATLRHDTSRSPLTASVDAANQTIGIDATSLADGKYTIFVDAKDRDGRAAKTLRLVFWIEAQAFSWQDSLIYMAMVDRFKNGDAKNDPPPTQGTDRRADFQGGDLEGIRSAIAAGMLDQLGVNTIWLSPFHTNANGAFLADDGVHLVTGYHGYWPTKAREVDPRIGGGAALVALVAEAHAHGIRVLQDFVVNHVHRDHEYVAQHPSWFRTGCVCGTTGCDWTTHRLDCVFADYLPDVDWTVPAVSEQFAEDAVFWLDAFDLDGLRVDAVKHVEDACVVNLTTKVREEFEATGTRVFMTGETAMGWNGDSVPANQTEYDTISRYIGPNGLDGQFDFVLHHAAAYRTFDYDDKGLLHADFWTSESARQYPAGAVMTPYLDSHDTPRSVTLSTYRGQDTNHAREIAHNKWDDIAAAPSDSEPYQRHRLATAWLFGLPGAPLLYYGDEYGQWGGADPNNRMTWRGDQSLAGEEATTLAFIRKLGLARRELVALRRGAYRSVYGTDDALLFARQTAAGDVALVALTRLAGGTTISAPLGSAVAIPSGTVLRDRLGGPSVVVTGGAVTIPLGPRGAAILAP